MKARSVAFDKDSRGKLSHRLIDGPNKEPACQPKEERAVPCEGNL
ncbi:hypothetical protein [Spirosoma litoris]